MEAEQEIQEGVQHEEEAYKESLQQEQKNAKTLKLNTQGEDRSSFVHGLSVGLGMGCIATFVIVWLSVFFAPHLSSTVTYETMLSVFIYPLVYLLAVGLIALTAGIVREYHVRRAAARR